MKKIATIFLCFFITTNLTHARFLSVGPRIGAYVSQIKVDSVQNNIVLKALQQKNHWGYHIGIFTRLELLAWYFQNEVLLTNLGIQYKEDNKTVNLWLTKLDIPVMLGLSFFGIARVQFGPIFSVLLSAKEGDRDVREDYNSITAGWQGGLGFDIWRMAIDLKYEESLSKFGNNMAGMCANHRRALWILSIGIDIF
jgi:hypothetical protein